MKAQIKKHINIIVGESITDLGKAADILWVSIGKKVKVITPRGEREVGTYALHLQCKWRLLCSDNVWIGYEDEIENWKSKFECSQSKFVLPNRILSLYVKQNGEFHLDLENNWRLEVEINTNLPDQELWRFINSKEDYHMVVLGTGIEIVS